MPRKILAISSGGGHWVQLRRLSPAFDGLDVTYVSVKSEYATDVKDHPFFVIRDANRWSRISFLVLAVQLLKILWRVKPDLVITTGAAPGLMALLIAKIFFGAKTMWVDSIANCERMSGSGRLAGRFADVCLTQWPHLQTPGGPEHWGAVL
ncbi:MAG: UDP-N-acetylglucosamine--LPS N-acetylglucosamine transferase [Pseudomonadota bacterium]